MQDYYISIEYNDGTDECGDINPFISVCGYKSYARVCTRVTDIHYVYPTSLIDRIFKRSLSERLYKAVNKTKQEMYKYLDMKENVDIAIKSCDVGL